MIKFCCVYLSLDEDQCELEESLNAENGVNVKNVTTQREEEFEVNEEMEKMAEGLEEEDESEEELRKLDRDLTFKSQKLKLSAVNVRNIIHVSLIWTNYKLTHSTINAEKQTLEQKR